MTFDIDADGTGVLPARALDGEWSPGRTDAMSQWTYLVFGHGRGADIASLGSWMAEACPGRDMYENGARRQRSWSNVASTVGRAPCVSNDASSHFNVSPLVAGTVLAKPGETLTIPLMGWSPDIVEDWFVRAGSCCNFWEGNPALSSDTTNDGRELRLTLRVPEAAQRGSYGVVVLYSSKDPHPDADTESTWPVFVYVP